MALRLLFIRKLILTSFAISAVCWIGSFTISFLLLTEKSFEFTSAQHVNLEIDFDNRYESFSKICSNNIKVQLVNFTGLISFGLTSFVNLVYNGLITGAIIKGLVVKSNDVNSIWLSMLPHSFELLGTFLSGAIGLSGFKIGKEVIQNDLRVISSELKGFILRAMVIALMVTIVAAYVESFLSV